MKDYKLEVEAKEDIVKFKVIDCSKFKKYKYPLLSINVIIISYQVLQYLRAHQVIDLIIIAALVIISIIILCRQERHDSLIVIKNIGIQLNSQTLWKFWSKSNNNIFIPLTNIIDLVIHEGFYGYGQVIFYMCILTKNTQDNEMIKVVFSELLPRKDILIEVWQQSRKVLFNGNRHWRRIPGQGLKPVHS